MSSPDFQYRGARALVLLHEQELRQFIEVWKSAKNEDIRLTETTDPDYASLDTLLSHVLWWARDYMIWSCEKLGLPDPGIEEAPPPERVAVEVDDYLEHLLEQWRGPMANVPEEPFYDPQHATRWNIDYPVEALLEHAVVHPMRHRLQLLEIMNS
jgi:hypothetical protein